MKGWRRGAELKRKKTGRPRDPEIDDAVLAAAESLLVRHGYTALSIEQVAATAQVGKQTVYRRWPSKISIVYDLLRRADEQTPSLPDTGSFEEDLRRIYGILVDNASMVARILPPLVSEIAHNSRLAKKFHDEFIRPRRDQVMQIVRRAIARGELAASADPEIAIDLLLGIIWYRRLITGAPPKRSDGAKILGALRNGIEHAGSARVAPKRKKGAASNGRRA